MSAQRQPCSELRRCLHVDEQPERTSLEALAGVAAFVILLFVGSRLLPGPEAQGTPLPSGGRLAYRLNGLRVFLLIALVAALGQLLGWWSLSVLYHQFLSIFLAANMFAFVLTGIVFLRGRPPSAQIGIKILWRRPCAGCSSASS